LLQQPIIPGLD